MILLSFFVGYPFTAGCASRLDYRSSSPQSQPEISAPKSSEAIPYRVRGKTYYPLESAQGFSEKGIASWYGPGFHGKLTSNKEVYDMNTMTAAHRTLPFNTRVRVTNLENGRSATVRINDRGPFVGNRIIDLSYRAGKRLGIVRNGTARVRLKALDGWAPSRQARTVSQLSSSQRFTVQMGVFKNRQNAERMAQNISGGRLQPFEHEGNRFYRVLTEPYSTYQRAATKLDALQAEGRNGAFIILEP